MINLENRIERDELIDDYFNKGYACDIREVYQAIVNTIADLEYANDEKIKEIERLNKMLDEKFMKENTFLVENGIICTKNKEMERLKEDNEYLNKVNIELSTEKNRLNNIINEINSIVEYWGYDKEQNDISSFRMVMKSIKDILGSDKE